MIEVHKWLYDSAKSFWVTEHPIGFVVGCIFFMLDIWYLMNLVCIPFYIAEIARNTRRGR